MRENDRSYLRFWRRWFLRSDADAGTGTPEPEEDPMVYMLPIGEYVDEAGNTCALLSPVRRRGWRDAIHIPMEVSGKLVKFHLEERYGEAIPLLDEILAADPLHFEALRAKGICLEKTKHYREAVRLLELAEDFGKIGVMGMESKGIALLELGEPARAQEVLEKALATETTDEQTQYRIARCAALLGRHQRALTELRRAGETDPDFFKKAAKDPVFHGMREMEAFRELVAEKEQLE